MNYALVCLIARNALDINPSTIERACRRIGMLAKKHAILCDGACNEAGDFDAAIEETEATISALALVYGCVARFERDPRGITVFIVGSDGNVVDA